MTGIIVAEKWQTGYVNEGDNDKVSMSSLKREKRSCCRVATLSAVVTAVATGCLLTAIFMAVQWNAGKVENDRNKGKEWISWTRVKDGTIIHESALFDSEARTGLMVSAESYKIAEDNSIALHDFQKGIVAIRDFRTNTCYVSNIKIPDFQTAKRTIEDRRGKQLPIQELRQAHVRPSNMTTNELGSKLTSFCDGAESHWFDVKLGSGKQRKRAADETIPPHVSCYYNRLELGGSTCSTGRAMLDRIES